MSGIRTSTDLAGRVLRVTIDRPDRMNAVDLPTLSELGRVIRTAGEDVRTIVLTGSGRAFCSGADLLSMSGASPDDVMDIANGVIRAIVESPVPVVAAVNGPAVGFGVALACAADLTYAAENAYFALSFTSVGLMPDGGSTALVTAAIGRARVSEMTLLGERLSAADAERTGLIGRALPAEELSTHVAAVAARLATGARRALELTKRDLVAASIPGIDATLDRERSGQIELMATADFAEGASAVMSKRPPNFS
ncbi:enoyl-CoA hydratase [Rhodococcus sp. ABRD24]|uniref:enoyl-CoA hydratase n=1 Tax=Rhodococcus sp. ABRD24 TaxID=2507582 RepID=UPI00103F20A3|nr:enoyl-CoA hydratase [Rhodococcus sp. ABRD24]QBJ96475.1 enoyl-CoA hydratase [Rhodococcus sp. ABRD24]